MFNKQCDFIQGLCSIVSHLVVYLSLNLMKVGFCSKPEMRRYDLYMLLKCGEEDYVKSCWFQVIK